MDLYFAGAMGVEFEYAPLLEQLGYRLVSYHYMTPQLNQQYYVTYRDKYTKIILDSGAFSAWNAGANINLAEYTDYILQHLDGVDYVVNLDVIPGKPGQKKIPLSEVERSAAQGYENYYHLLDVGVPKDKLIHVFHQNENFKWLERMLDDGMPYIGISPANDRTTHEKIMWLDEVMRYICNSKGEPIVKFHGFAVTSFRLMLRYPWTSVDSSTWAVVAGRGITFIPIKRAGKWDYTVDPIKVSMSQVTAKKDHFEFQTHTIKKYVFEYLEEHNIPLGKSEFVLVNKDYKLQEKERVCPKKYVKNLRLDPPPEGKKWIERVVEVGILNNWRYRQYLNTLFLNEFAKRKPQPEVFKFPMKANFGLV